MLIKTPPDRLGLLQDKKRGGENFCKWTIFLFMRLRYFFVMSVDLVKDYTFTIKLLAFNSRPLSKITPSYICEQQAFHKVKLNSRNGPASLPWPAERGGLCKDLIESLSAPTIHSPGAALSSYCRGTMT